VDFAKDLIIVGSIGTKENEEQVIAWRPGCYSITTSERLCI